MNTIRSHPYPAALVACLLGLSLFLGLTNPQDVSVGMLVIPVILFFLIAFCASQILITLFKLFKKNLRKRRIVALMGAALVTVIMILQSTGGISGADIILLALIIVISVVYVEKF